MNRLAALALLLAHGAAPAFAREATGQLGRLLLPNEGAPAIAAPGLGFPICAKEQGEVTLRGAGGAITLKTVWEALPGGYAGWAEAPAAAPPGWYDVALEGDVTPRAVYLRESFPPAYAFVAVSGGLADLRAFLASPPAGLTGPPAFAVLFLRDSLPTPAELGAMETPVVLVPGADALQGGRYETLYGPPTRVFPFGADGFLCMDTSEFVYGQAAGETAGTLQRLRRDIKPGRWSIGLGAAYGPSMHPRLLLTLFLDDPLEHALFGSALGGAAPGSAHAPFNGASVAVLPEKGGAVIVVNGSGIEFQPAPDGVVPPQKEESP